MYWKLLSQIKNDNVKCDHLNIFKIFNSWKQIGKPWPPPREGSRTNCRRHRRESNNRLERFREVSKVLLDHRRSEQRSLHVILLYIRTGRMLPTVTNRLLTMPINRQNLTGQNHWRNYWNTGECP